MSYDDRIIDPLKLKAARLAKAQREGRKITQDMVAKAIKSSQKYISRLETGKVKTSRKIWGIAKFLNVHPEALFKDEQEFSITIRCGQHHQVIKQHPEHPLMMTWIPVISLEEAGKSIRSAIDIKDRTKFKHISPRGNGSGNMFAVRINGDSMACPYLQGADFRDGYIVEIDPEKKPKHGDFVLIRKTEEPAAMLRQLIIEPDAQFLRPLNPQYPTKELTPDIKIIGVALYAGKGYGD